MNLPLQLTLNMQLNDNLTFVNYCIGSNQAAVNFLKIDSNNLDNSIKSIIYIYGKSGVGLSHLLQASCHQIDSLGGGSMFLPMSQMVDYSPDIIEGIERLQQICIDDIEAIAGIPDWEEAIFNLFNRLYESNVRLIISAKKPPSELTISLKDLTSRLSLGVVFKIHSLSDNEKLEAIKIRAKSLGHDLSEDVIRFILSRIENSMNKAFNILNKLDYASLKEKRKITIPFIKKIMQW